ncbi:hypothetical protein T484DRAFT_1781948 [Baffinella frigidus]|nr:hypothetical protein T484DRAFT_1781948 [Cryptophyta sp. CCMP2293]
MSGTTTTVTLGGDLLETDGAYENLHLEIIDGLGKGQSSRIFGYTGGDRTADVILEIAPDFSSSYAITRLSGFEVGDDYHSWALASSAGARSAAMHGETGGATHKTFVFQGKPELVNRVTASGLEHDQTYPRLLGDAVKEGDEVTVFLDLDLELLSFSEGDEVTVFLDLDLELLSFSVNGERLGEAIQGVKGPLAPAGVKGPLVPAASCSSATEVAIQIGGYRRWAPETGWASEENAQDLGFTEGEERQLKALFKRFDPKKTGEIKSVTEGGGRQLKASCKRFDPKKTGDIKVSAIAEIFVALEIQMKQSEREDLMDDVDADGSGTLDWIEFLKLMASVKDMGSWNGP